jgi:protein arginine N-methyltransferase 5
MVTARITNSKFQTRVMAAMGQARANNRPHVHIDALTDDEVNIYPGLHVSNVIALASPWVEIDINDPLLSHVSKQVLALELAYAAFCGLSHVIIPGPNGRENAGEYAQAIQNALSYGTYLQLLVQLPIDDWVGDDSSGAGNLVYDPFSAWDVWNTIRTVCKYHSMLSIGERHNSLRVCVWLTFPQQPCRSQRSSPLYRSSVDGFLNRYEFYLFLRLRFVQIPKDSRSCLYPIKR